MFQFSGFASIAGYYAFSAVGCPIQKPTTITPAKGLIVDIVLKHTSFFGSNYLGIHH